MAELRKFRLWSLDETAVASLLLKIDSIFMPWYVWQ
jgi:hypothetical protein